MDTTNAADKASLPKASIWDGASMTQDDMMLRDAVLVLDHDDNVIGSESKKNAHVFSPSQPRGVLHRAFSVFLFDEESGDLLLQKRAASKITFPNVWTNTCCSHPLHAMEPPEVDALAEVADGSVPGSKHAAIRKLEHELGIAAEDVPHSSFVFLTRMHYWAADTVTHGKMSPWGEHEIDFVLFVSVKGAKKRGLFFARPRPDEVDDVWWIGHDDLARELVIEGGDRLWSPWFRLIAKKWLLGEGGWWKDVKKICAGKPTRHDDFGTIHRFDPPREHFGGAGEAGQWLGNLVVAPESKGDKDNALGNRD
uniref:isopentenyl-diphosphate Delta-isomerase n=1 Tax=Corethron hystrix TaxID=216773 RepID=A0A7S1FYU7_9STRA|mmetsp:Transcript_39175/g.91263  ORF Transcript_39175/g.91263 Transcript_39175/m.91263 type:complete len:309 (+) Transcript_39175:74-1000(+)